MTSAVCVLIAFFEDVLVTAVSVFEAVRIRLFVIQLYKQLIKEFQKAVV